MILIAEQVSNYKGTRRLLPLAPKAKEMIGDRGYDADWFRDALKLLGVHIHSFPSSVSRQPSSFISINES
jgi:hypothetical protein